MTLHKLGWEVDAYIRRQWLGNHRACILHTSTFIPIPKMRGVSDVIPHLCPIAQAHRLWQKRMDDALFRTFLSPTPDRHPLSQEQVDTFCAAWLSMFHYAVQCVQRALQPDIRSARDAVGLRAVEPWLRSFGDAWRNGLMQLRSLRPEEDPRPYVVHYRNDLRMSPLSCTVGHWPDDVARLAHAEIRPWSDRRGHIDPRTGTFIADTLQLHAEP